MLFPVFSCLIKHTLADVCDLIVLIYVDNLHKYEYGSDLAMLPVLAVFPSNTLFVVSYTILAQDVLISRE
jgi:hypothetical protein